MRYINSRRTYWLTAYTCTGPLKCPGGRCAPAPLVWNAVATLNQTSRSVTISCMTGYRFPDGLRVKRFYCHQDGTWDYDIPRCDGMYSNLLWRTRKPRRRKETARCCMLSHLYSTANFGMIRSVCHPVAKMLPFLWIIFKNLKLDDQVRQRRRETDGQTTYHRASRGKSGSNSRPCDSWLYWHAGASC